MISANSKNGTTFMITEEDKLKRNVGSRSKRDIKKCKKSVCDGVIYTQCNNRDCVGDGAWCMYFDEGTIGRAFRAFDHVQYEGQFCMPCCFRSKPRTKRMPSCTQINRAGLLCQWFDRYGRCGDNFGT